MKELGQKIKSYIVPLKGMQVTERSGAIDGIPELGTVEKEMLRLLVTIGRAHV